MNSFLKYIIYFLLGLMIHFLLKNNLVEGYGEHVFPLFSRIMGSENGDYRGPYMGCKKYECDNIYKYSLEELNSKPLVDLQGILTSKINETRFSSGEISDMTEDNIKTQILKIDKANNYVNKENYSDINYLTCNNEMDYSTASVLGGTDNKCNHEKCCFNTKCSSDDVQSLQNNGGDCGSGRILKENAHCGNKKNCKNKYISLCCSEHFGIINESIKQLFVNIYNEDISNIDISINNLIDNPLPVITAQNILDYVDDGSVTLEEISEDIKYFLSIHDYNSLNEFNIYDFNDLMI